jgi:formylglycine-generating enzyme required for sulfatase activity
MVRFPLRPSSKQAVTTIVRLAFCAMSVTAVACQDSPELAVPRAPRDAISESVQIPAGLLQVGTAGGTIRRTHWINAFSIFKTPVTVGQYRKCLDSGACDAPALQSGRCTPGPHGVDGPTFLAEPAARPPDVPVTCVSAEQAANFCQWVGGRLPTTDEWALAARGPDVQRWAWGNDRPTCERHARTAFSSAPAACCGGSCNDVEYAVVGRHAAGASRYGVQDVLLTQAEIVRGHKDAAWRGCAGNDRFCLVHGTEPGAIDAFVPVSSLESAEMPAGFRCVLGGGS